MPALSTSLTPTCGAAKTLMHDLPLEDHGATFPVYTALKRCNQHSLSRRQTQICWYWPPPLTASTDSHWRYQKFLICTHQNIVFAYEPVPSGTATTCLILTANLQKRTVPHNLPFDEKIICWYYDLLLHHKMASDYTHRFGQWTSDSLWYVSSMQTNGVLSVGPPPGIIPFHAGDRGEVWGEETHEVMQGTTTDWTDTGV